MYLLCTYVRTYMDIVCIITFIGHFTQTDVDSLMDESIKMKGFKHTNVLGLLGVCVDAGSAPYVILPFMSNGSLLDWLKRERNRIVLSNKADATEEQVGVVFITIIKLINHFIL